MDEKLRQILDQMPERPPRSKLEPYAEVIRELRKKRRTYQEIAAFLKEHVQVSVAPSTVFEFMKRRTRQARQRAATKAEESVPAVPKQPEVRPVFTPSADEVRERMRTLKQQPVDAPPEPKRFHFDPEEPLTLDPKRKEK